MRRIALAIAILFTTATAQGCAGADVGSLVATARDAANKVGPQLAQVSAATDHSGDLLDAVCLEPKVVEIVGPQCTALEDAYGELWLRVVQTNATYRGAQDAIDIADKVAR